MPDVELAPSMRAPAGTFGAYLTPEAANGHVEAFLLPREFAHLHSAPDASFHLTLPEPIRGEAIQKGWAEPHPLAGQPSGIPFQCTGAWQSWQCVQPADDPFIVLRDWTKRSHHSGIACDAS